MTQARIGDRRAEASISAELADNEKVVWMGRPRATTMVLEGWVVPSFMVAWTTFAAAGFTGAIVFEKALPLTFVTGLMFALGIAGTCSVVIEVWSSSFAIYAITDRRLIEIKSGIRGHRVTSWMPPQITSVERRDRGRGRGDVVFHRSPRFRGDAAIFVGAFVDIADVRSVEALVRQLATAGKI